MTEQGILVIEPAGDVTVARVLKLVLAAQKNP